MSAGQTPKAGWQPFLGEQYSGAEPQNPDEEQHVPKDDPEQVIPFPHEPSWLGVLPVVGFNSQVPYSSWQPAFGEQKTCFEPQKPCLEQQFPNLDPEQIVPFPQDPSSEIVKGTSPLIASQFLLSFKIQEHTFQHQNWSPYSTQLFHQDNFDLPSCFSKQS